MRRQLERIVGPVAKRILDGIADLAESEGAEPGEIEGLRAWAQEQYKEGDFAGAVTTQEKYLAEVQRLVSGDAPAAVTATNNLAVMLQKTGDEAKASSVRAEYLDWVLKSDLDKLSLAQRAVRDALASRLPTGEAESRA